MKTVSLNDEVSIISIKKLSETTMQRIKQNTNNEERLKSEKKPTRKSRKLKIKLKAHSKKRKSKRKRNDRDLDASENHDAINNILECQLTEFGEDNDDDDMLAMQSPAMKKTIKNTFQMLPSCPEEQAEVLSKLAEQALLKLESMSSESRRKSLSAIFDNKIDVNNDVL